jgi:dUTP pyrophosphatase
MSCQKIKVVLASEHAKLPKKAIEGDSGYDLFLPCDVTIEINETKKVYFDIKLFQERSAPPITFLLSSRSSFAAKGMFISLGILDPTFQGNIAAIVSNFTAEKITLKAGTRIAQIVPVPYLNPIFEEKKETDLVEQTLRGSASFGSSGGG